MLIELQKKDSGRLAACACREGLTVSFELKDSALGPTQVGVLHRDEPGAGQGEADLSIIHPSDEYVAATRCAPRDVVVSHTELGEIFLRLVQDGHVLPAG